MKVKTTSPVEGKDPGKIVEVSEERGRWLLSAGYAVPVKEESKPKADPPPKKKVAATKPVADD